MHILPKTIYNKILKSGGENNNKISELLQIKETGISISRFEKILNKENYKIIEKSSYLINPN